MRTFMLTCVAVFQMAAASHAGAQEGQRRFIAGEWVEIARVGGLESPLMAPSLLKAAEDFFVVYDYSEKAIQAFSYNGELLWRAGRAGAGPNEFRNPTDIQVGPDNSVWVTDPENVRLSIINAAGQFAEMVRLPPTVVRCAPAGERSCWAASSNSESMAVWLHLTRGIQEYIPAPEWLKDVHLFSRETILEAGPKGNVVLGYLYNDRWAVLKRGMHVGVRRGIEEVPFAKMLRWRTDSGHQVTRIDTAAVEAARSMAISGGRVHTLFGAGEGSGSDTVDTYDLNTGRYQGSYRLPEKVDRLAVSSTGMVVTLVREPVPTVRVWRFSGISRSGKGS